jgi:hypothetical protein
LLYFVQLSGVFVCVFVRRFQCCNGACCSKTETRDKETIKLGYVGRA